MDKAAIIYCPTHRPFTSPLKRWRKIAAVLDKYNVEYDMVQSEERQSVERLVMMMLNNGYKTIVIAGGDSALNDAVNCLMRVEKNVRDSVVLGVIPNGIMNDFALFWGYSYDDLETSIKSIAQRRIRRIDVGCVRYTDKNAESKQQYFLNCVNIGLLARIQKLRQDTRRVLWSRTISFAISLILMLLHKTDYKVSYVVDRQKEEHRVMNVCISKAHGYGMTPNATPYSGLLDMTVVRSSVWTQFFEAIELYLRGKLLNHKRVRPYRATEISMKPISKIPVCVDGHPLASVVGSFTVSVDKEEIQFVV